MKTVSPALTAHLASEVTHLATCWKLTRADATVMGFTDHDRDLTLSGVTYHAATGFTPSAVAGDAGLAVDNLDVQGMLDASAITEADLMAGKYDYAAIEIFMVNHQDLTQGTLVLRSGRLGEVTVRNHRFTVEVRGLTQALQQTIGELYTPACRARLGDARCKVNLASHTVTGSVTATVSASVFKDTTRTEDAGLFTFGTLTFTGGQNAGLKMEVKEYTPGLIVLALPMSFPIAVSDTYSLTKGCDKTTATCQGRFSNILNYRGEPHVPGLDKMLETAGTRSGA